MLIFVAFKFTLNFQMHELFIVSVWARINNRDFQFTEQYIMLYKTN